LPGGCDLDEAEHVLGLLSPNRACVVKAMALHGPAVAASVDPMSPLRGPPAA